MAACATLGAGEYARAGESKVPEITAAFWVIKILATTLGETGGDAVSMSMHFGYAAGTALFFAFFVAVLWAQLRARGYNAFLYWTVIVATTTTGTTMADFADRSLGIGYVGGAGILFACVLAVLGLWYRVVGSVSVNNIVSRRAEVFYWLTILFSNTLGTALGDFLADSSGLGYEGGALVFGGVLVLLALAYFLTDASRTLLFWAAFILTRPLGATLGDIITKPPANGGLGLSRIDSSLALAVVMVTCILLTSRRSGGHPGQHGGA